MIFSWLQMIWIDAMNTMEPPLFPPRNSSHDLMLIMCFPFHYLSLQSHNSSVYIKTIKWHSNHGFHQIIISFKHPHLQTSISWILIIFFPFNHVSSIMWFILMMDLILADNWTSLNSTDWNEVSPLFPLHYFNYSHFIILYWNDFN